MNVRSAVQFRTSNYVESQKTILTDLELFRHPEVRETIRRRHARSQTALTDLQQGDIYSRTESQDKAEAALQGFLNAQESWLGGDHWRHVDPHDPQLEDHRARQLQDYSAAASWRW